MTGPVEGNAAQPDAGAPLEVIGLAALTQGAYAGMDLQPIWAGLLARVRKDPYDAAALMDMGILLQLTGDKAQGLEAQRHALAGPVRRGGCGCWPSSRRATSWPIRPWTSCWRGPPPI